MQTLQGVTGPAISGGYSPGQVGGPVVGGYRPAQIGGPGTYLPYQTTDWTSMFGAMMPMIMMIMMFAILMPMFKGITESAK
jgi:hypothetical protein